MDESVSPGMIIGDFESVMPSVVEPEELELLNLIRYFNLI